MRSPIFLTVLAAAGLLAGCSFDNLTSSIQPYRIDVRQGNYVDQEMVSQLKKGMTRDQVRFVLGTPLVVDPFRTDRWDYVYLFQPGGGEGVRRTVSVFFVGDRLDHVDGDVAAADGAGEAGGQPVERSRVIEITAPEEKK
jgi:outer membrane protein assembly factor BamE